MWGSQPLVCRKTPSDVAFKNSLLARTALNIHAGVNGDSRYDHIRLELFLLVKYIASSKITKSCFSFANCDVTDI